jgi:dTDP-4-dehydrorhamnose reductase
MTKFLVTGDAGLLGSSLACAASRLYEVLGVSRSAPVFPSNWRHTSLDLRDADATRRYLDEMRPDTIVHCAAMTDVEQCEAQPADAHAINVEATERLARWAGQNGAQFTHVSTDSVFDGSAGGYREEDPPRPLNQYARTKLAGENEAARWCADSLIVRTNFYGWNQTGKANLGKWMLGRLRRGEPLAAFSDVRFSPLFVNDLAKLILDLSLLRAQGLFHVAAQNSCSKYEFALLLGRAFGLDTRNIKPIPLEDFPFRAQRPRNTSLAVTKCGQLLGREMPTVEQGTIGFVKAMAARDGEEVTQFTRSLHG